jgi:DNA-binding transcriptional ArsR family regulator
MTTDELDPLIHVPARLRIVATLAALPDGDELSFTRLQDMIGLTPGNLITHLRKLEDAGYVSMDKRFVQRKPQTRYALTDRGRTALLDHVAHLEMLLRSKKPEREKDK